MKCIILEYTLKKNIIFDLKSLKMPYKSSDIYQLRRWIAMDELFRRRPYKYSRLEMDKKLIENYGFGSKPDPLLLTSSEEIRSKLLEFTNIYYDYFSHLHLESLDVPPHPRFDRTYKEILFLMNWHEAEHNGQCQIIWNTFKSL